MSEYSKVDRNSNDRTIIYHFDVDQHSLPLKQFVRTATATEKIVNTFNKRIFKGKDDIEIRIAPPEQGGLIELLEVVVSMGSLTIRTLKSDVEQTLIKNLTNHDAADWERQLCSSIRNKKFEQCKDEITPQETREILESSSDDDPAVQEALRELQAAMLAKSATGFLKASEEELDGIKFPVERFKSAHSAKNDIYQACIDNDVKALSFSRSDKFQDKERDFGRFIKIFKKKPKDEVIKPGPPPNESHREFADVTVHSPNWERTGRGWEGSTEKFEKIEFWIEDHDFWQRLNSGDIKVKVGTVVELSVEWVWSTDFAKSPKARVLRVIKFNGIQIAK